MHELGIMTSVLDAVESAATDAGATRVIAINLRIGEMTEAIEDALVFAFEALQDLPEYALCKDGQLCNESHCGARAGDRFDGSRLARLAVQR